MKSVLISIQPKWCELIARCSKTIEVRKTKPTLETPFKCYIYCTQGDALNYLISIRQQSFEKYWIDNEAFGANVGRANGKVIGEFVCDHIDTLGWISNPSKLDWKNYYNEETCLTSEETYEYTKGEKYYEWHISKLKIYDKPRELSEFKKPCNHANDCCTCDRYDYIGHRCYDKITKPFQSWGYVVESEGKI